MEGQIGTLQPGAFADVLVLERDPLKDLSVLSGQGDGIRTIVKGGEIIKHLC